MAEGLGKGPHNASTIKIEAKSGSDAASISSAKAIASSNESNILKEASQEINLGKAIAENN